MKHAILLVTALLMGGCSLQQKVPPVTEYRLKPYTYDKAYQNSACRDLTLRIGLTQSPSLFQRQAIYYADESNRQFRYVRSRWAEAPDKQFRHLFEDALAQSGLFKSVISYMSEAYNDRLLEMKLTDFMQYFHEDGTSSVHFAMDVTLIDQDTMRVVATEHIDMTKKTATADAEGAVEIFDEMTQGVLLQTMEWLDASCR